MAENDLVRKTTVSKFYRAWVNMKTRCSNKNSVDYKRYGGRGISVCDKWKTFDGFIKDMFEIYKPELTLDRIDTNKGYYKENCRWVTRQEQSLNTRNVQNASRYEFNGKNFTCRELSKISGIKRRTLHARLAIYKWPIEKALFKEIQIG